MPVRNLRGGKGYKKGKKNAPDIAAQANRFTGREEGQDYGRVVRLLGNRRVLCFCNEDGAERVCKIRGALCQRGPQRQRIDVGDIVILSYRDFEGDETERGAADEEIATAGAACHKSGRKDVADILLRLSRSDWKHVRREEGISRNLFITNTDDGDDIFDDGGDTESNGSDSDNSRPPIVEEDVDIDDI